MGVDIIERIGRSALLVRSNFQKLLNCSDHTRAAIVQEGGHDGKHRANARLSRDIY